MPTFKVTVEGKEYEVDQGALVAPDGVSILTSTELDEQYVTKQAHDGAMAQLRTKHKKDLGAATDGKVTPEELIEDEEQLQHLADIGRDKLLKMLKVEDQTVDVERIRKSVEESFTKSKVKPLEDTVAKRDATIERFMKKALKGEVLEAAGAAGIRQGTEGLLVDHYSSRTQFSEEHDQHFLMDGDQFAINTASGDDQPPYMPIAEDIKKRIDSGEWASLVDSKARSGANVNEGGGDRSGGSGGKFANVTKKSDLADGKEKSKFISEKGLAAFEKLPA